MSADPQDRRAHSRQPVTGSRIAITAPGGHELHAQARDVSRGGIFVLARQAPPVGTEVTVRLVVGQHESRVRARGVVVRHENTNGGLQRPSPAGFAIRFNDPAEAGTALLEELIEAVLAAQPRSVASQGLEAEAH